MEVVARLRLSSRSHPHFWLRGNARGCDGGVRQELAERDVRRIGLKSSPTWCGQAACPLGQLRETAVIPYLPREQHGKLTALAGVTEVTGCA
jgi:hypothetical protein